VHASTKKDKCIFCFKFFHEGSLSHHYRRKHKTLFANAYKCKFHCRRYFLTEADCEEHTASAHTECLIRAEAMCLYCNKICIDKRVMQQHINKCHSAVKILCKFFHCGQYFHTQTEADKHFEQQHQKMEENKKYCCLKCNYRSVYQKNFTFHISRMHGDKILLCTKCSRCFSSSVTLKVHIKQAHSPQKICPHCNITHSNISMHLKQEKVQKVSESFAVRSRSPVAQKFVQIVDQNSSFVCKIHYI
jgi:hypothetical protein